LLVLAGFDWDWTTRGLRLAETDLSMEELDRALHNGQFPEWMGAEDVAVYVEGWADASGGGGHVTVEREAGSEVGESVARPGLKPKP